MGRSALEVGRWDSTGGGGLWRGGAGTASAGAGMVHRRCALKVGCCTLDVRRGTLDVGCCALDVRRGALDALDVDCCVGELGQCVGGTTVRGGAATVRAGGGLLRVRGGGGLRESVARVCCRPSRWCGEREEGVDAALRDGGARANADDVDVVVDDKRNVIFVHHPQRPTIYTESRTCFPMESRPAHVTGKSLHKGVPVLGKADSRGKEMQYTGCRRTRTYVSTSTSCTAVHAYLLHCKAKRQTEIRRWPRGMAYHDALSRAADAVNAHTFPPILRARRCTPRMDMGCTPRLETV
ncbi:hypothetical protein PLICRDRAFT_32810 [Plicaturopsis crispa FD-325 SS-3]|uniref:Uncharacterized protein n=1 Tax=Plicaturopsis crispa FD-325 SS-3 TaxID=944288 RepID=A0A0C9T2X0_PLICR|nr:hypothetical protein PLICRDRAFT_32810 [Plicaturopsis crispa FD-325 SS-3]